jgi:hypothetical protein
MEGLFYGLMGGILGATLLIIPWYVTMYYTQNSDFAFWINQLLSDLNLGFLKSFNISFILIYYLVHMFVGGLLGVLSSFSAVIKYLE